MKTELSELMISCKKFSYNGIFRKIALLQLGVEAKIDRQANTVVNATIYQFLIEDMQKAANIA